MTETAVKANTTAAKQLFERGKAAAQSGNRRLAAGLLTRAVRLDPGNEQAWLWLSGVLDDPQQIAFCLRSVLKINPANQRAIRGLEWLEQRQLLKAEAQVSRLSEVSVDESAVGSLDVDDGSPWWVRWRQSHRENNRLRLVLWSLPLMLLCLALLLYQTFAYAVAQSNVPLQPTVVPTSAAVVLAAEPAPQPTMAAILENEPASLRDHLTAGYLSALEPQRQRLRNAVDSYLNATSRPGGASVSHVAAAQNLRNIIEAVHAELRTLTPPQNLQVAHEDYLAGLELEIEALDAIAEFYSSYQVEQANRAARLLQQASARIDRARTLFDNQQRRIEDGSFVSSHSIR
jgi:tetratricopeptide (TPR) repeat protein